MRRSEPCATYRRRRMRWLAGWGIPGRTPRGRNVIWPAKLSVLTERAASGTANVVFRVAAPSLRRLPQFPASQTQLPPRVEAWLGLPHAQDIPSRIGGWRGPSPRVRQALFIRFFHGLPASTAEGVLLAILQKTAPFALVFVSEGCHAGRCQHDSSVSVCGVSLVATFRDIQVAACHVLPSLYLESIWRSCSWISAVRHRRSRICTVAISGRCAESHLPAIGVSVRSFRAHPAGKNPAASRTTDSNSKGAHSPRSAPPPR